MYPLKCPLHSVVTCIQKFLYFLTLTSTGQQFCEESQESLGLTEDALPNLSQEESDSSKFGDLSSDLWPGSRGVAISFVCRLEKEEPLALFS